ncbi:unnamed protein product [Effrenium voratum]|nr:unnamed protein product [Effrenium voratum]
MRTAESTDSDMVRRLERGAELEILAGECRRFRAKDSQGTKGWISAFSADGATLLEVTQRGNQSLYVGAGQALGGNKAAEEDPRKAALAAAERRQASALSRGVGEKAAKNLQETEKRQALLKKLAEVYGRRKEDVPLHLQSASLEALQKHLANEESRAQEPARPAETPQARPQPVQPAMESFNPPARQAGVPAASASALSSRPDPKREAARERGLAEGEIQAVYDLEAMGFDFFQALQSYCASGRNQELAANLLLEGQEPAMEPMGEPLMGQPILRPLPPAFPGPALNESQLGLSALDKQKLQRIMELGFDRPTAVKALWSCNLNEEEAGNRLLA